MKSPVFWDITPCIPLKVNRRFGGTCRVPIQVRRISQARKQHEARDMQILRDVSKDGCSVNTIPYYKYKIRVTKKIILSRVK
jgi:hypothetical protein